MFHKKRFRPAIAVILTLLLTVALAPAASAQSPPPPSIPGDTPTQPPPPPPPATPDPPGPGNGTPPPPPVTTTPEPPVITTPEPPDMGNGNGDMMMGSPGSWPPPNAIVHHAATPVQVSALSGGLRFYFIGADGAAQTGPFVKSFDMLAKAYPSGGAVSLYSGANPGTGKSVMIDYLPAEMKIRVSTYYADKPPHDFNKPYVFIIDADHSVNHEKW